MKRFAGSRWAAVGVAALVGVLMMAVAVVSTGLPGTGSGSSLGFDSDVVADLFSPAMRVLYAAVLLAAIYRFLLRPRAAKRGRRRASMPPWATLAAMAVVAAVVLLVLPNLHFGGPSETQTTFFTTTTVAGRADGSSAGTVPVVGPDVWVVVAAAIAGLAFVLWRRRSQSAPAVPPMAAGRQVPPSIWIESDLNPSDSRSRVLAAYRGLARRATEVGLGRARTETVTSHLRRLGKRGGAEPTGRLAYLYNRARFSAHPTRDSEVASAENASAQIAKGIEGAADH
jgi:hypothetical protein